MKQPEQGCWATSGLKPLACERVSRNESEPA